MRHEVVYAEIGSTWRYLMRDPDSAAHGLGKLRMRAGNDRVARERLAYREAPDPSFRTYGPKTRREFFNLLRWNGGERA